VSAIASLAEDRVVEGVYAVARKERRRTRGGAPYLALELVDPSGRIEARVWSDVELLDGRFGEGDAVRVLGHSSSGRIGTLVKDVVTETLAGGLTEIRMSPAVLTAVLDLRTFLFDTVYENSLATVEFKKATGILTGLWEKVHERPQEFLEPTTVEAEGLDAAARDFVAGMTDRYAVRLFEQLFIPKPWAID
jgi:hypothetical protein